MENKRIIIYTDGSCSTQFKIGGWAAVILVDNEQKILQGSELDTTHNRMELLAIIESIKYVLKNFGNDETIQVNTDSQYVCRIPQRAEKLLFSNFISKKGKLLQNNDLVKILIELLKQNNIQLIKVKAHQKDTGITNYNRVVDKLSRQIVRNKIKSFKQI